MNEFFLEIGRYALPALGLGVALICALRLLRRRKSQASPGGLPGAFLLNTVNRDRLPLTRYENSLGRSRHCDVVLNYPAVSRFHAVIARRRAGWVIVDTGSRIGVRLDGQPVERRAPLHHGQALNFGSFDFLFCDEEEDRRIDIQAARPW